MAVADRPSPSADRLSHVMLESIGEGVLHVDADGRITFANRAATQMLGWSPDEIIGRGRHALIHHSTAGGEPLAESDCAVLSAIRDGQLRRRDDEAFWRKDGTSVPVEYLVTPVREGRVVTGAVVAFRDLTDRRHADERTAEHLAAKESARAHAERLSSELQRLLMQVPAAICITHGPEHTIHSANALYRELVGGRNVEGMPKREAFPELEGQGVFEVLDRVYASGEPYAASEVRRVWGRRGRPPEEGFVNVVYQPLRDAGNHVYGIMIHVVDVTDLVRSRHEVEARRQETARLAQVVARINRELDDFAYIASHDLKAPLRGIASLAQWIEEDVGPKVGAESRRYLDLLHTRVRRMEVLIDAVLKYSRAGRVRDRVEVVDVAALLAGCIEFLNPPAGASIVVAPGMPVFETERVPLEQIFMNLLGNALKHSRRPDVTIRIAVAHERDFYRFSVQDNGPGIPREFHDKIWEIFQTLEPRDRVEGAGIGLALVKKNVVGRGGRVWLESEEGRGATIFFLWPKSARKEEA